MEDIVIRNAVTADLPVITDILRATGWFDQMNDSEEALAQVEDNFLEDSLDEDHSVLVAETEQNEVVGYGVVHWLPYLFLPGPEGFISEMFVAEPFRGKGIGRKLLNEMKRRAMARDCYRLHIVNGKGRESFKRGFYEKYGFTYRDEMGNFVMILRESEGL